MNKPIETWLKQMTEVVEADIRQGGDPELNVHDVSRALLLVVHAVLGPNPCFDRRALLAVTTAPARLRELWADPSRQRLVSRGAYALVTSAEQLALYRVLSEEERTIVSALLEPGAEAP